MTDYITIAIEREEVSEEGMVDYDILATLNNNSRPMEYEDASNNFKEFVECIYEMYCKKYPTETVVLLERQDTPDIIGIPENTIKK